MALDTHKGLDEGHLVAAGSGGHEMYQNHMGVVEEEARKVLPPGAVFAVGGLSDGTGHGHVTLNVQGEHVHLAEDSLRERFPALRISPVTHGYYDHLVEARREQPQQAEQSAEVARVREEVEKVCVDKGTLFDIHIVACRVGAQIAVVVYVQGEHRDAIRQWLVAVFGEREDHSFDVRPLSLQQYQDLNRTRARIRPNSLAEGAQSV